MLETGLRIGEALNLEWSDVILEPIKDSRFGYLRVREGKSKYARRVVPLTDRPSMILTGRLTRRNGPLLFANRDGGRYDSTSIDHLHRNAIAPRVEGETLPALRG